MFVFPFFFFLEMSQTRLEARHGTAKVGQLAKHARSRRSSQQAITEAGAPTPAGAQLLLDGKASSQGSFEGGGGGGSHPVPAFAAAASTAAQKTAAIATTTSAGAGAAAERGLEQVQWVGQAECAEELERGVAEAIWKLLLADAAEEIGAVLGLTP
jgi:hypothetical protein